MQKQLGIFAVVILLARCSSPPPPVYSSERPHIQRDEVMAASNRFPEQGNPDSWDSYFWYRPEKLRNVRRSDSGDYSPITTVPYSAPIFAPAQNP